QGLSIFTAVFQIASESENVSCAVGLAWLFTTTLANAALAVGAVRGSSLALRLGNRTSLEGRSPGEQAGDAVRSDDATQAVLDSVQSTCAKPQTGSSAANPQSGSSAANPQTGSSAANPQTGPGQTQS